MQKRTTARAIINIDTSIVLIHRTKAGVEYWVTPGGTVEIGETPEHALQRELQEELGVEIVTLKFFCELDSEAQTDLFYVVTISGQIGDILGPEKLLATRDNQYAISFVPVSELPTIHLVPESLKKLIMQRTV